MFKIMLRLYKLYFSVDGKSFKNFYNEKSNASTLSDEDLNEFAIKVKVKRDGKEIDNNFPPGEVVILPSQRVPLSKMSGDWQDRLLTVIITTNYVNNIKCEILLR